MMVGSGDGVGAPEVVGAVVEGAGAGSLAVHEVRPRAITVTAASALRRTRLLVDPG